MLVHRPHSSGSPLIPCPRGVSSPYPVISPRNPGSFQGWGPKL